MNKEEIIQAIEAQQMIQQRNPPTSQRWQEADDNLRRLVGKLNGVNITRKMWDAGITKRSAA